MTAAAGRVRIYGDPCLRQRARTADPADPTTRAQLDAMWRILRDGGGVGLAAPQIGSDLRLVVIRDPGRPHGRQRLDLVNPRVTGTFGAEEPFEEGCLSFPGIYLEIRRPKGVEVSFLTADGDSASLRDEGLVARIVQHEVDHLDGVLFIDRLPGWRRWLAMPRLLWLRLRHGNRDRGSRR